MPQDKITITLRNFPLGEASRGVRAAQEFLSASPNQKVGQYHGAVYGADVRQWKAEMWVYRTKTGVVVRWLPE